MKKYTSKRIQSNSFRALSLWTKSEAKKKAQSEIQANSHALAIAEARPFMPGPVVKVTPHSPTVEPVELHTHPTLTEGESDENI